MGIVFPEHKLDIAWVVKGKMKQGYFMKFLYHRLLYANERVIFLNSVIKAGLICF